MSAPFRLAAAAVVCVGALGVAQAAGADWGTGIALGVVSTFALLLAKPRRAESARLAAALRSLEERIEGAAEARHRMRLEAETAGRFREEFVAAVRHELKTPLNAILGFTEVLLQGVDGPLDETQREDVEAIRSAGVYLQELVEAVLSEWVPSQETPQLLEPIDIGALVREVARLLEGQLPQGVVEMRCEVDPTTPSPYADGRRLRQVLINLGTNAIRATREGFIALEAAPHEDGVRLTVRDSGPGIPETDIPRLFEEFSQAGSRESRRGGTGLGLALTRDLVEWHGGRIDVETRLGEGSAFHVILPRQAD